MGGTWALWLTLTLLTLSHVAMFAMGVGAYHCVRWISLRQLFPQKQQPQLNEGRLMAMAEKLARQQVQQEQFSYFQRNQEIQRPEIEESFVPSKKSP